jgi:hypothetical protein
MSVGGAIADVHAADLQEADIHAAFVHDAAFHDPFAFAAAIGLDLVVSDRPPLVGRVKYFMQRRAPFGGNRRPSLTCPLSLPSSLTDAMRSALGT